jgi:hypothetical protein
MKNLILSAIICLFALPAFASGLPPLARNTAITDGLIAVGMAIEISEQCPEISARTLKGLLYLNALKHDARAAGYSGEQIDAFIDDNAEKAKLETRARAILAERGAVPGDPDSYCTVGRAEVAADSATGRLLRD